MSFCAWPYEVGHIFCMQISAVTGGKGMRSFIKWIMALAAAVGGIGGMGGACGQVLAADALPEILQGQTFVYDELETGEGTTLYTLLFTGDGYRLYNDNGVGVIAQGTVSVSDGRTLVFEDDREATAAELFYGSYTGSAFESPSVTLEYGGRNLAFEPDSASGEYVYLSYLGVFEGEISGEPVMLILDRWYEFYLYFAKAQEPLVRGTYEIYEDGTVEFTTLEQEVFVGKVDKGQEAAFDIRRAVFSVDLPLEAAAGGETAFTYAEALKTYDAEHAMGTYTLSLYDGDVYVIRGVDGFVKSMGTIDIGEDGGAVTYFPRAITDEAELEEKFTVAFTCEKDALIFPSSTYLLPRSGNIDEETGFGAYWSAGTTLEFIENTQQTGGAEIAYEPQKKGDKEAPLLGIYGQGDGLLQPDMPSLGTARPLVLLIDFPDYKRPRFVTAEAVEEALFGMDSPDSLSAYYYRSSYGNLTIDGTVLDWYRMEKERAAYESDKEIMEEALDYYINEKKLDLTEYDADQNGCIDSLYVLWAGTLDTGTNTWSAAYRSRWFDSPEEWDIKVAGYIFVPGTTVWSSVPPLVCNINSLTHETGHLLGLNDYYSYDTSDRSESGEAYTGGALEGGIGGMDMMDANIGDHNAFSKWLLGWLEPKVIEYEEIAALDGAEYTLGPSNEQGDAIFIKLKDSDSLFTELLVIEAVSPTVNAGELTRLKEPVVRILHVDASLDEEDLEGNWNAYGFKFDNSFTSTKFIGVLEADGKDELLNYLPAVSGSRMSYDPEDYYTAGALVTPNTYPNTNGYDVYGNATVYNGLTITVVSVAENGEAVIRLGYKPQEDTLVIVDVQPEPAVVPYQSGKLAKIPADTREITVVFDREIAEAGTGLSEIMVLSGNQMAEASHVLAEGKELKIVFDEPLQENCDYTVVIPAGSLEAAGAEAVTNNFNSIFGFVTEK